jgi:GR25 family glycosyltransferase involved in LPS biosynthesis
MNNELLYLLIIFLILIIYLNYKTEKYTDDNLNKNDINVYVINLVKNKQRLNNFKYQYNNSDMVSVPYIVYPAIVGKNLDLNRYVTPGAYNQIIMTEKTNIRKYHYELTRGAVGCYLSHINIYKQIAQSDKKYGIIFEDDVMIARDFFTRLNQGLKTVPINWDIYLLGVMCLKCDIKANYADVKRFWGMHGYLVKKESAIKLIKFLDHLIKKQIDSEISLLIKNNKLKVYSINPIIVTQDNLGTDIQVPVINNIDEFKEEFTNKIEN